MIKRKLARKIKDLDQHHWVIRERLTSKQAQAIWILMSSCDDDIVCDWNIDGDDLDINDVANGRGYLGWSCELKKFYLQDRVIPEDVIVSYVRAVEHITQKIAKNKETMMN